MRNYIYLTIIAGSLFLIIYNSKNLENKFFESSNNPEKKIENFYYYLKNYYVDKIDLDSLSSEIIKDVVKRLDPHSFYISKNELPIVNESMSGSFEGIGVNFFFINDTVSIIRVLKGSPAEKFGLMAGDRILMSDGDTLHGKNLSNQKILDKIKGPRDSKVNLEIFRPTSAEKFKVNIERGKVEIGSVFYYELKEDIGYIKIDRFIKDTDVDFKMAIENFNENKIKKLVLDLRDNPGGYLFSAEKISNIFLEKDQKIVIVKSSKGEIKEKIASGEGIFKDGNVCVLINKNSASASEVLAGALQDNDRAFIIGETSFGKGLVQNQFPLGSKEAIRLTVAKYYTPSGRSIQKPFESYNDNIDYLIKDSKKKHDQAIDTATYYSVNGKKLFTKGGILPDKILSNTEAKAVNISYEIIGIQLNRMVFEEVDKNRKFYSQLKKEDVLKDKFIDKSKWIELLNAFSVKNKIDLKSSDYKTMVNSIKSILVFQLFDRKTQIEINNTDDPYIFEAIKILK
ncbi:MAG: S41 family peptidase [Flavobacteriaceae bacterium]